MSLLEQAQLPGVDTDCNFQLNVEDAHTIAQYDIVIFADASMFDEPPFVFHKIEPTPEITFTTHEMSAESVLALCSEIGRPCPVAYMLGIRGYEWEFQEGLTEGAKHNLGEAYNFLLGLLHRGTLIAFDQASQGKPLMSDVQ